MSLQVTTSETFHYAQLKIQPMGSIGPLQILFILAIITAPIVRIWITVHCANKAKSLNRSSWGWGLFGFFLPIIAIIWIQFMKPKVDWEKDNTTLDR